MSELFFNYTKKSFSSWLWIYNTKQFCLFHSFPLHVSNWFHSFKHQINSHRPYIPCRRRWNNTLSLIGRLVNELYHRKLLTSVSAVTVGLCAADPLLKPLLSNPLNQPSHSCSGSGIMGLRGNRTISPKTWSGARGQRPLAGKHRGLYDKPQWGHYLDTLHINEAAMHQQ